jgi:hypothetical protein
MILSPRLLRQSRAVCFPPNAACHFSFDTSGSILLTNSAHSIDFFDTQRKRLSETSSSTLAAAGQLFDQSPFLMRDDENRVTPIVAEIARFILVPESGIKVVLHGADFAVRPHQTSGTPPAFILPFVKNHVRGFRASPISDQPLRVTCLRRAKFARCRSGLSQRRTADPATSMRRLSRP